jgi:anti-sigma B factor antagonist
MMTLESTPARPPTYATVVAPAELDMATSPAFRDEIERAIREHSWVIVDLSRVEFIDSTGLTALLWGRKGALAHHGRLVLVGPNERTKKILGITQLDRVFEIYPSTDLVPGNNT